MKFTFREIKAIAVVGLAFCTSPAMAETNDGKFEAPVALMVGDKAINAKGRMLYPSPAIFDVDNDGKDELVIGTIFGEMYACENANASAGGDPTWEAPKAIETTDGEPIRLNNW